MHIRNIILRKSLDKKNVPILVKISEMYSQLSEKCSAFVRHFFGRTFYLNNFN